MEGQRDEPPVRDADVHDLSCHKNVEASLRAKRIGHTEYREEERETENYSRYIRERHGE